MGKQNYIGGNDFYNYPQVLSNDEIEITDIELNEKKILNKSNYKRNQFLLCVTRVYSYCLWEFYRLYS